MITRADLGSDLTFVGPLGLVAVRQMPKEGVALAHVSAQLGHADMATTCIYLRGLGADEAFEAARGWPS